MLDGRRTGLPLRRFTFTFGLPGDTGVAPVLFLFRFCTRFCTLPPPCDVRFPRASRGPRIAAACAEPVREIDARPEPSTISSAFTFGDGVRDVAVADGDVLLAGTFCGVGGMMCVVRGCGAAISVSSAGGSAKAGRGGKSSSSGGGSLKEGLGGRLSNSGGGSLNAGRTRPTPKGGGGGGVANTGGGGGGVFAFCKTGGGGGGTNGDAGET